MRLRPLVAAFEDGLLVGLDMEPCTEEAPGHLCLDCHPCICWDSIRLLLA